MNTSSIGLYMIGCGIFIVLLYQGAIVYEVTFKHTALTTGRVLSPYPNQLSPLFSLKPLTTSLHPRYKLWTEMDTQQQDEAIQFVGRYMSKYGKLIAPKGASLKSLQSVTHGDDHCPFAKEFEKDGHKICGSGNGDPIHPPCNFISFGINDNPSFVSSFAWILCRFDLNSFMLISYLPGHNFGELGMSWLRGGSYRTTSLEAS